MGQTGWVHERGSLTPLFLQGRRRGGTQKGNSSSDKRRPASGATIPSMIRCRDIHKAYHLGERTIPALRGVDLHIREPGFYAIMGQSGSGKSTLLYLLAALERPDRGEIWVGGPGEDHGTAVHQLDERAATLFRRKRIGIVFQQYNLIPTLTARENVELPGMLAGEDPAWLRRRSDELLERLGMSERAGHRPDALSGGEQQRVAIGRALLYAPPVVLADEPTGNLDSVSAGRLWRLLGELAEPSAGGRGTSIVMVTHEPAAAVNCRRIYVLSDGRITGQIDTEGLDAAGVASRYQGLVGRAGDLGGRAA
jgi:putative ABC transport system ATP-binding protein